MNGEKTFTTRSLQAAIYLVSIGAGFPEIDKGEHDRAVFHFEDPTGEWRSASDEFFCEDPAGWGCQVSAPRLFQAQHLIRDAMTAKFGRERPRWGAR